MIAQAPAQPPRAGAFCFVPGCEPTHLLRQEARWQSRRLPTCCVSSAGRKKRHSPSALLLEPRAFLANSSAPDSDFQDLLHRARHLVVFCKESAQLVATIDRDVARPALGGVEGDSADGGTLLGFRGTAVPR